MLVAGPLFMLLAMDVASSVTSPQGDGARNAISVSLVAGSTSARDDTLTPLAFTGPTSGLALRYARRLGPGWVEGDARGELGVLFNRFGHQAFQLHYELGGAYLQPVARLTEGAVALGGVARAINDLSYLASWDDAHGYWLAAATLGPAVRGSVPLGPRARLEWGGDVTLLAVASRPPERRLNKQDALTHLDYFVGRVADDPHLATPLSLQQGRLEVAVRRAGAPDVGKWRLAGELRFARHGGPQPYLAVYTGLAVARAWSW
jgi:hypothetical protein